MSLDEITLAYEKIRDDLRDFQKSLAFVDIEDLPADGYNYWQALAKCCHKVDTILRRFEQTVDEYIYESEFRERQDRVTLNPEFKKICDNLEKSVSGYSKGQTI